MKGLILREEPRWRCGEAGHLALHIENFAELIMASVVSVFLVLGKSKST